MKRLPIFLILIILLGACGCKNHEDTQSEIRKEFINNKEITYLPEIYYGDPDIFRLAVELLKVGDLTDSVSYIRWEKNVNNLIQENKRLKTFTEKQIDNSLSNLTDSILKYGTKCNASISEKSYLLYGWSLFEFLNNQKESVVYINNQKLSSLNRKEYYEFIGFWSNFSELITYKINENTGSSGAYDVPIRLANIITELNRVRESKEKDLPHDEIDLRKVENLELELIAEISKIWTVYLDEETEQYKENEYIETLKRSTIVSLQDWISIGNEIAYLSSSKLYLSKTLSYLDILIKGIKNI